MKLVNDTPGSVEGGCGREGCGHAYQDHYRTRRWGDSRPVVLDGGPCNARGNTHHCICYQWVTAKNTPLFEYVGGDWPGGQDKIGS